MKRILFTLSVIILSAIQIQAGSLKSIPSDKNFPLNKQIVLSCKDIPVEDNGEISSIVTKNGGTILYKFSVKKFILPIISVKHADRIKGTNDRNAFKVEVTQTSVKVSYTSDKSLKKAIETIKGLVTLDVYGNKCIRGGKYIWVNEGDDMPAAKKSHMANEMNLLFASLDKMPSGSETELILITPTDWMVESPALESITENKALYSTANGYVTCESLKEAIEKANSRGVVLKVTMRLHEENLPFKDVLGHSLYSVEGMRLLRAAIQQWHDICGLDKIYTDSSDRQDMEMVRFDGFLEKLSTLTGTAIISQKSN